MDRTTFEACLGGLWNHLGLETPVFRAEGEIVLSVDAEDAVFRQGDDGRTLIVEAHAGFLTGDPASERSELEMVLKIGLALVTAQETIAVCEEDGGVGRARLLARGCYRYQDNDFEKLSALVSNVLSGAQALRSALVSPRAAKGARLAMRQSEPHDASLLILTP